MLPWQDNKRTRKDRATQTRHFSKRGHPQSFFKFQLQKGNSTLFKGRPAWNGQMVTRENIQSATMLWNTELGTTIFAGITNTLFLLLHLHFCLNLGRLITQNLGATSSLEIGRTVPSHFVRSNLPPLLVQLKTVSQQSKASTIEGLKAKLFQACWVLKVLAFNLKHFYIR